MRAEEGTPRQVISAARPLAVRPRAQEEAAEQAAGRFFRLGRLISVLFYRFSIFQKQFQ